MSACAASLKDTGRCAHTHPPADSLLAMHHCLAACPCSLLQALATQEANRAAQNRLPPLWAIVAMVVLGFNEFMAVSVG